MVRRKVRANRGRKRVNEETGNIEQREQVKRERERESAMELSVR